MSVLEKGSFICCQLLKYLISLVFHPTKFCSVLINNPFPSIHPSSVYLILFPHPHSLAFSMLSPNPKLSANLTTNYCTVLHLTLSITNLDPPTQSSYQISHQHFILPQVSPLHSRTNAPYQNVLQMVEKKTKGHHYGEPKPTLSHTHDILKIFYAKRDLGQNSVDFPHCPIMM